MRAEQRKLKMARNKNKINKTEKKKNLREWQLWKTSKGDAIAVLIESFPQK